METNNNILVAEAEVRAELTRIGFVTMLKNILDDPINPDTFYKKIEPYFVALKDAERNLIYMKELTEKQGTVEKEQTAPF